MNTPNTSQPLTYKQLSDEMLEVFAVAKDICDPPVIKLVALFYYRYDEPLHIPSTHDTDRMIRDANLATMIFADYDQHDVVLNGQKQAKYWNEVVTLDPIIELTNVLTENLPRIKEVVRITDEVVKDVFPNVPFPNTNPWTGFDQFLDSLKVINSNVSMVMMHGPDISAKFLKPILPPKARHSSLLENRHPQ